jgi:hypothetical protein
MRDIVRVLGVHHCNIASARLHVILVQYYGHCLLGKKEMMVAPKKVKLHLHCGGHQKFSSVPIRKMLHDNV